MTQHATCYRCGHPIAVGTAVCPECGLSVAQSERAHRQAAVRSSLLLTALVLFSAVSTLVVAADGLAQLLRPSTGLWDSFRYSGPGALLTWVLESIRGLWNFFLGEPAQSTWRLAWVATLIVATKRLGRGTWRMTVLPIGLLVLGPIIQIDPLRSLVPGVSFGIVAVLEVVGTIIATHVLAKALGRPLGREVSWAWTLVGVWAIFVFVFFDWARASAGVGLLAVAALDRLLRGSALAACGVAAWRMGRALERESLAEPGEAR